MVHAHFEGVKGLLEVECQRCGGVRCVFDIVNCFPVSGLLEKEVGIQIEVTSHAGGELESGRFDLGIGEAGRD